MASKIASRGLCAEAKLEVVDALPSAISKIPTVWAQPQVGAGTRDRSQVHLLD